MKDYLLVGIGSALGGLLRYGAVALALSTFGTAFPWGTLTVNVVGSFAIGVLAAMAIVDGRFLIGPRARLLLVVGFCGGLTTFSFFSWQIIMLSGASITTSLLYAVGSPVGALAAVWAGYSLVVSRTSLQA